MLSSVARWLAFAVVLTVSIALRTADLARRPMHADEANQAVKTGDLLESGKYAFDPTDHHGPTLYYFGAAMARARGERTLGSLDETTVRLVPALFGVLCVLIVAVGRTCGTALPLFDRGLNHGLSLGPGAESLTAGALLAVCPAAVYYSRYYIHEMLLLAFVLLAFFAWRQWRRTGVGGWAAAGGLAAGCALATKETAGVFFVAAAVAAWLSGCRLLPQDQPVAKSRWQLAMIAAVALVTAAAFYTSFGRNPAGLHDAILAPRLGLRRATESSGHEKPWWYYAQLLTWHEQGGLMWHQGLLATLALIGAVAQRRDPFKRGVTVYLATVLIALSITPYKTPWNVVQVLPPMAVLAAAGAVAISRLRTGRIVGVAFVFLAIATLFSQSYRAAFRYAADARNPYAYVHSSPDVKKIRRLVEAALAADAHGSVRIVSPEYWPLPWYLRGLPRIGYWTTPPTECDGAMIVAAADLSEIVSTRLHGRYRQSFLGLRPGFTLVVFTPEPP